MAHIQYNQQYEYKNLIRTTDKKENKIIKMESWEKQQAIANSLHEWHFPPICGWIEFKARSTSKHILSLWRVTWSQKHQTPTVYLETIHDGNNNKNHYISIYYY